MSNEIMRKLADAYKQVNEKKKKLDPVDKDELKGSHDDRDDKDIDNDGDLDLFIGTNYDTSSFPWIGKIIFYENKGFELELSYLLTDSIIADLSFWGFNLIPELTKFELYKCSSLSAT